MTLQQQNINKRCNTGLSEAINKIININTAIKQYQEPCNPVVCKMNMSVYLMQANKH